MGTFSVPCRVEAPRGGESIEVVALVDTGAIQTLLPRDVLEKLGVAGLERSALCLCQACLSTLLSLEEGHE